MQYWIFPIRISFSVRRLDLFLSHSKSSDGGVDVDKDDNQQVENGAHYSQDSQDPLLSVVVLLLIDGPARVSKAMGEHVYRQWFPPPGGTTPAAANKK